MYRLFRDAEGPCYLRRRHAPPQCSGYDSVQVGSCVLELALGQPQFGYVFG